MTTTWNTVKNNAYGALAAQCLAGAASCTLGAGEGARFASPMYATIHKSDTTNAEIVKITNVAGDVLTITRAQQGTVDVTHTAAEYVRGYVTAADITEAQAAITALENADTAHAAAVLSSTVHDLTNQAALNMLVNGDMEINDPPTGWTLAGGGASQSRSNTQYKFGSYSLKVTRAGTNCYSYQALPDPVGLRSKTITFSCWVWASVASRARIFLTDSAGTSSSSYHTGGSTWEKLTVTRTVDAAATYVWCACQVLTGDTSAYFDGAKCVIGSSAMAFTPQGSALHSNTLSTTRAMDAASGDVAYTGIGFKPRALFCLANVSGGKMMSVGFCDFGLSEFCLYQTDAAGTFIPVGAICEMYEAAGKTEAAIVKSMDADGFTLTWTRTGATASATATLYFLAVR